MGAGFFREAGLEAGFDDFEAGFWDALDAGLSAFFEAGLEDVALALEAGLAAARYTEISE